MIVENYIDRAMNYWEYGNLLQHLMKEGKTTGENQSETYLNYTRLNLQRMLRLDKTAALTDTLKDTLSHVTTDYTWVVLTEGWCGDAGQNLPILALIERSCPRIALKLLLRDENLDLMDQYLTQGGRAIPKLICVETNGLKEVFDWGPRPAELQAVAMDLKKKNTPLAEKALLIQKWYNTDKTLSLQHELMILIKTHLK